MSPRLIAIAVTVLACLQVRAQAADNIWFSLESGGTASATVLSSGPGQVLAVSAFNPGSIRVALHITSDTGALAGFGIHLESSSLSATFSNGVFSGTGYDQIFPGGPDGTSAFTLERGSLSGTGSVGAILSFDINLNLFPPGPVNIYGDFGGAGIPKSNGFAWYGFVGPNPISYGIPGYSNGPDTTLGWGDLPVIVVNSPEPGTLTALALLGALSLRRRRGRVNQ